MLRELQENFLNLSCADISLIHRSSKGTTILRIKLQIKVDCWISKLGIWINSKEFWGRHLLSKAPTAHCPRLQRLKQGESCLALSYWQLLDDFSIFQPQQVQLWKLFSRKVDLYLAHAHPSCWQTRRASLSFTELHLASRAFFSWGAVRIWCWKLWNSMRMPWTLGWICLNCLHLFSTFFICCIWAAYCMEMTMNWSYWYNLRFLWALLQQNNGTAEPSLWPRSIWQRPCLKSGKSGRQQQSRALVEKGSKAAF